MERRNVIGGGLAAGLSSLLAEDSLAAGSPAAGAADEDAATARAIDALRSMLERQHLGAELGQIRAQQRTFLKANQKFPDFIDVGIDVWERMHDWHVRNRQPLTIVRTTDGHYGMPFGETTLILQPHQVGDHISWGYDTR